MTQSVRLHLPERRVPGMPLGRHVNHDPRSRSFAVTPARAVISARWQRETPILEQTIGACTGNALTGVLGTDPFWRIVTALVPSFRFDEDAAVTLYSAATSLDDFPGSYPPDDTGSDGLSVCKAAQAAGLISGYLHAFSLDACKTAIQTGPFITGTSWYESMDRPDSRGLVTVAGQVRGGHEYEVLGYDAAADVWEFANSWSPSWGLGGRFFMSSVSYARLLGEQGDATVPVPLTAPAPTPTPPQTSTVTLSPAQLAAVDSWAHLPHGYHLATEAARAWRAGRGL